MSHSGTILKIDTHLFSALKSESLINEYRSRARITFVEDISIECPCLIFYEPTSPSQSQSLWSLSTKPNKSSPSNSDISIIQHWTRHERRKTSINQIPPDQSALKIKYNVQGNEYKLIQKQHKHLLIEAMSYSYNVWLDHAYQAVLYKW